MLGYLGGEVRDDERTLSEGADSLEGSGMLGIAEATTVDHT